MPKNEQIESFFRATLDALPYQIAVVDSEGTIIAVNRCWQLFAFQNEGDMSRCGIGTNYIAVCDSAIGESAVGSIDVSQAIRGVVSGKVNEFVLEYPCNLATELRWFSVRIAQLQFGDQAHAVISHEDITGRKRAELALRESDLQFSLAFEHSSIGMALADLNGRWTHTNQALADLTGYSREELTGMSFKQITSPEYLANDEASLGALRTGEIPYYHTEKRYIRKDGRLIWVLLRVSVLRGEGGNPIRFVVQVQDIGLIKKAERALTLANDNLERLVAARTAALTETNRALIAARIQAEEADRAKGQFLSRMSHELRTPLNSILGFGQLLQWQEMPPDQKVSVENIVSAGRHLLEQINAVLDIVQSNDKAILTGLRPTHLGEVIQQVVRSAIDRANERKVAVDNLTSVSDKHLVLADPGRLSQVLDNLLSNAILYNRPGGRVELRTLALADGRLRTYVRDWGLGIRESDIPKLFTPFERLCASDSDVAGSGLGLAQAKHLIEAMGGTIGVESVEGEGTTVWFDLQPAS